MIPVYWQIIMIIFRENELKDFIPEFLKEGEIDGRLLVFPVAKSTEILFVNKTIFDRFSADTGASMEQLTTWGRSFLTWQIPIMNGQMLRLLM